MSTHIFDKQNTENFTIILATERELIKMNIIQDDKWSFCGEVETQQHVLH